MLFLTILIFVKLDQFSVRENHWLLSHQVWQSETSCFLFSDTDCTAAMARISSMKTVLLTGRWKQMLGQSALLSSSSSTLISQCTFLPNLVGDLNYTWFARSDTWPRWYLMALMLELVIKWQRPLHSILIFLASDTLSLTASGSFDDHSLHIELVLDDHVRRLHIITRELRLIHIVTFQQKGKGLTLKLGISASYW